MILAALRLPERTGRSLRERRRLALEDNEGALDEEGSERVEEFRSEDCGNSGPRCPLSGTGNSSLCQTASACVLPRVGRQRLEALGF